MLDNLSRTDMAAPRTDGKVYGSLGGSGVKNPDVSVSTYPGIGESSHDTSGGGPVGVKFSAIGENFATDYVVIYMAFNDRYTGGSA